MAEKDEIHTIVTIKIELTEWDPVMAASKAIALLRLGKGTRVVEVETLRNDRIYTVDLDRPNGNQIIDVNGSDNRVDGYFKPTQHCTSDECPYTFSHTAKWCGYEPTRRCCHWCYPDDPQFE